MPRVHIPAYIRAARKLVVFCPGIGYNVPVRKRDIQFKEVHTLTDNIRRPDNMERITTEALAKAYIDEPVKLVQ